MSTTKLSRRTALAALTAGAAATTAAAIPVSQSAEPDAELLALGKRFDELERQYRFVRERDRPRTERYEELIEANRGRGLTNEGWEQELERIGKQLDEEFGPTITPDGDDILNML